MAVFVVLVLGFAFLLAALVQLIALGIMALAYGVARLCDAALAAIPTRERRR